MQNPILMIQQFRQFAQTLQSDPKSQVEQLLQSGKMTQAQFNELQKQATEFQKILGTFNI